MHQTVLCMKLALLRKNMTEVTLKVQLNLNVR